MKYDYVTLEFENEETSTFNKRKESLTSLFEVKTAATICADPISDTHTEPIPRMCSDSSGPRLATAVGSDVTIFITDKGFELASTLTAGSDVHCVHWVANSQLLAVISSGILEFFDPAYSQEVLLKLVLGDVEEKGYSICSRVVERSCIIVISTSSGGVYTVSIPHWDLYVNADQENMPAAAAKCMSGIKRTKFSAARSISKVVHTGCEIVSLPARVDDHIAVISNDSSHMSILESMDVRIVVARSIAEGRYIVILDEHGVMHIYDPFVFAFIDQSQLAEEGEQITDLHILDENGYYLGFDKIAIIVARNGESWLEVRSRRTRNVSYSLQVRSGSLILPAGDGQDRVLFIVEPFDSNKGMTEGNAVVVREVCEAQPEACLDRMLRKRQFKEAEEFAIQYKLDVQKVHISHMSTLRDEMGGNVDQQTINEFLRVCDLVKDHNLVGETIIAAVTISGNSAHVMKFLEYSNKISITDIDTTGTIDRLKYILGTLRLIIGDNVENAFDSTIWSALGRESDFHRVFVSLLNRGFIREARILWARHSKDILLEFHMSQEITKEGLEREVNFIEDLFKALSEVVQKDVSLYRDCIELGETDILLELDTNTRAEGIICLCNFAEHLMSVLEQADGANFPDNALYVAGTLNRLVSTMVDQAITPNKQAEVGFVTTSFTFPFEDDETSVFDRMNDHVRALTEIKELKDVYCCPLSYQEFREKSVQEICYEIINKALSNPAKVKQNVEKYARPYMKKSKLPADDTLYMYIRRLSQLMAASDSANVYDVHCLTIMDAIESVAMKNKAVLEVARRASVPWKEGLQNAVEKMLSDRRADKQLVDELQSVCVNAKLAILLRSYGLPINAEAMSSYLRSPESFGNVLHFIFVSDDDTDCFSASAIKRLKDAESAIDLYNQLVSQNKYIDVVRARGIFLQHTIDAMNNGDGLTHVIDYLVAGSEKDKVKLDDCEMVIKMLVNSIDLDIQMETESALSLRLARLTAIESLIIRFKYNDKEYQNLGCEIRALRKLQENYKMCFRLAVIRNPEYRFKVITNFINQNPDVDSILDLARVLNFSTEEAYCIVFEMNQNLRNAELALGLISSALEVVKVFPDELSRHCVKASEMILLAIYDLSEASDLETLNNMYDLASVLHRKVPELSLQVHSNLDLQETVFRICGYLDLLMSIFRQCAADDSDSPMSLPTNSQEKLDKDKEKKNENSLSGENRIFSQSHRLGFYRPSIDGPIFEKIESARAIGKVARTIIATIDMTDEFVMEVNNEWEELFNHLNVHGQYMLEFNARVFAYMLPCMQSRMRNITCELSLCAKSVVEKIISSHPADLWSAIALLLSIDVLDLQSALTTELRQFAISRKNPQMQLNYLRIAQFLSIATNQKGHQKNLQDNFLKALWQKRMRKLGVSTIVCKYGNDKLDLALEEFSKTSVDPVIVLQFCESFGGSSACLLNYAVLLILHASESKNDKKDMDVFLQNAELAIEISGLGKPKIFETLHDLIYVVCPYNYEVHSFIAHMLNEHANDSEKDIVASLSTISSFLTSQKRKNTISKHEYTWYIEREKAIAALRKEHGVFGVASAVHDIYRGRQINADEMDTSVASGYHDDLDSVPHYQREDLLLEAMPSQAVRDHRLPMHLMLYEKKDDLIKNFKPLLDCEVDIYNLKVWQDVVRRVYHIRHSGSITRIELMADAVTKKATQALQMCLSNYSLEDRVPVDDILTASDAALLRGHMSAASRRPAVISTLMGCFKKMTTCELKLRFINLGLDVAGIWINNREQFGVDDNELKDLHDHIARLKLISVRYQTEGLLKGERIFDEKTSDLIAHPEQLIEHIYEHRIDWDNQSDIDQKQKFIDELAAITDMPLANIQDSLVRMWLDASGGGTIVVADLNDTMGGDGGMVAASSSGPADDTFRLPIFESSVTRIVYLIRRGDVTKFVKMLLQIIVKTPPDTSSDLFKKKVLALCVMLRAYSEQDFAQHFKTKLEDVCAQIEVNGYGRLFALANLDLPLKTYQTTDKLTFARTLVSPSTTRQTPQVAAVAASLVIDYNLADRPLIEMLISKLHASRNKDMLAHLLKYAGQNNKDWKSLPLMWAKVFDWQISVLDTSRADDARALRRWIHFLFSCPVAGGRAIESVRSALISKNCQVAAYLLPLLGSFTQRLPAISFTEINPDSDLYLLWISKLMESSV